MPYAAPRPCPERGCRELITVGQKYCKAHIKSGWAKWQKTQGNTTERGYGAAWRKIRKQVFRRDRGLCQEHFRNDKLKIGTEVDHIVPKSKGGTDELFNLQLLCSECHRLKTHADQ